MKTPARFGAIAMCAALSLSCGKAPELPAGAIVLRIRRYRGMEAVRIDIKPSATESNRRGPILEPSPEYATSAELCVVLVPSLATSDWSAPAGAAPVIPEGREFALRVLPLSRRGMNQPLTVDFSVGVRVASGAGVREYAVPLEPECALTVDPSCFGMSESGEAAASCNQPSVPCREASVGGATLPVDAALTCEVRSGRARCDNRPLLLAPRELPVGTRIDAMTGCLPMPMPMPMR